MSPTRKAAAKRAHRAEQLEQLSLSHVLVQVAHIQAAAVGGGRRRRRGRGRRRSCRGGHGSCFSLRFYVFGGSRGAGRRATRVLSGGELSSCYALALASAGGEEEGLPLAAPAWHESTRLLECGLTRLHCCRAPTREAGGA